MDGFKHPVEKRVMDVTSDDNVKLVVNSILEEQGKIDIVVNNAGAIAIGLSSLLESLIDWHVRFLAGPLLDVSLDQARKAFETNTYSILRVAQAVAPSMVERKQGLIVNIGSLAGNMWAMQWHELSADLVWLWIALPHGMDYTVQPRRQFTRLVMFWPWNASPSVLKWC
jgi:NAD(P)-dependent dehydrogenase (short-subunit alcohol dehydrogenase family)